MKHPIKLLIIEDDASTCREYARRCEGDDAIELVGVTASSQEALALTQRHLPDVVALELELPNGSGNGLLYLSQLREASLGKLPYLMVVTNNPSAATHSLARQLGADFIITKSQSDYSVGMVLSMLKSIRTALYAEVAASGNGRAPTVEERIDAELDAIGISHKHKGRKYLQEAIAIVSRKKQPRLSAVIAQRYGVTAAGVERAMQHAINRAWKLTDIDTLERCYTARINPEKGVPTNTEFIYYYAEKVSR